MQSIFIPLEFIRANKHCPNKCVLRVRLTSSQMFIFHYLVNSKDLCPLLYSNKALYGNYYINPTK